MDSGFWIKGILDSWNGNTGFWIREKGKTEFWIQRNRDLGFLNQGTGFWIEGTGFWIQGNLDWDWDSGTVDLDTRLQ